MLSVSIMFRLSNYEMHRKNAINGHRIILKRHLFLLSEHKDTLAGVSQIRLNILAEQVIMLMVILSPRVKRDN